MDSLLERESVLAELTRLARQVSRGAGRMVLLRGEAGVGKTAVIRRFTAGLRTPVRVLWGWCDPLSAPRPLGPLADMLAAMAGDAVAGELGAAIQAGDTEAIYTRLLRLFRRGGGSVCVIEDVHWADGATLDLLRFLARRIEALPLLLIVTYREDEIGEQHPLAVALGDMATCAALTRIGLAPLSMAAVRQVAAGSGINAEELHRVSGGNPFYVTEVRAARPGALLGGELPRSVSEAVWGRLARLSPGARDAAHTTAVCGARPSTALVEAVSPGAAAQLGECLDAGVLVANGDTVGFRHELARRAALERIPDDQRRVLHKQALAVLSDPPIDPDTLAALAFHAEQAGDTDAVVRYGPAAAERATTLGAHREAAELYAMTLRYAHSTTEEQKVQWIERHALTSFLCGLGEAAESSWREAIARRHELGDRRGESANLLWLSLPLWALGRHAEANDAARESLRLAEDLGPSRLLAHSLVNVAELAAFGFDPAATDYAARAISLGTEMGERAVVLRARSYAALAKVLRTDTGWDELEDAWHDAMAETRDHHTRLPEPMLLAFRRITGIICWIAALHRDLDRASRYIAERVAYAQDRDFYVFDGFLVSIDGLVAFYRGDWDRAIACAEDLLTRPRLSVFHRIMPLTTSALIHARRGEQPVSSLLDDAIGDSEPDLLRLGAVWAARAEAAWLAGDDDTARAQARAGLAAAPPDADPWLLGDLQRWAHLPGTPPASIAIDDPVTPYQLEVSGDWQAAAAEWARRGCPYDAAIAQLGGDLEAVQAALATFRGLGARAAARRARGRLAVLRGRSPDTRRSSTSADPHGLTRRQREILDLLSAGHSDTEIAAALYLSPRTVNNHVGAILAKLGVHSRKQAAAYAQRQAKN